MGGGNMSSKKVKLGDFLIRSKIPVDIEDNKQYKRVTIRTKHQGVSVRDFEIGAKIGTKKQFILNAGQFVLSKIDAMYGAFGIAPSEVDGAIITGNFWAYDYDKNMVCIDWLNHFTNSPDFYDLCRRASTGITHRKYLDEDFFLSYEVNLPDLEDQNSLVFSINGIRDKISSLEVELSYQLTLLENLNQAILQEAVQGKLVPQDDNDEPASELLKRIKAEKELLIREKLIKQGKLQEAETLDELLFDIPKSWVWCKLDEICKHITDGTHQTPKYTKEGRIFLSAQNVKPFKFMPEEHKYVSEEAYQEYTKNGKPEIGDILIGRVGAGIGETAVIDKELDFCIYVSLALVQPFKTFVDSNYLAIVFNSPYGYKYAKGNISSKGGSAGNFNLGRIRSFLIPLPPLSEQKRIVSEIEKQFAKTKQLKEHIHANQQATEQLLKALLHQAFEVKKAEEINS